MTVIFYVSIYLVKNLKSFFRIYLVVIKNGEFTGKV